MCGITISQPPANVAGKLDLAGGTMTGQLVLTAAADGALKLTPTWNNGAVNFALIYGRVTNTASGADSTLLDLGTSAVGSLFSVDKKGSVTFGEIGAQNGAKLYGGYTPSNYLDLNKSGVDLASGSQEWPLLLQANGPVWLRPTYSTSPVVVSRNAATYTSNFPVSGLLFVDGAIEMEELSADPPDPLEGRTVIWQSDGVGSGDDGDVIVKITAGGVTKTITLIDFSAF